MLCHVMLCYFMLCYVMLCYVLLYYVHVYVTLIQVCYFIGYLPNMKWAILLTQILVDVILIWE